MDLYYLMSYLIPFYNILCLPVSLSVYSLIHVFLLIFPYILFTPWILNTPLDPCLIHSCDDYEFSDLSFTIRLSASPLVGVLGIS